MATVKWFEKCYCCFFKLRPKCIQLIALLANLVVIALLIWGMIDIPWSYLSKGIKICYYIICGLIIINLILLFILIIFRCIGTINSKYNFISKGFCLIACIFDCVASIIMIVSAIIILYKMYKLDKETDLWPVYNSLFSSEERAAVIFSTIIAVIPLVWHFFCVSFLYILITCRTNFSYNDYKDNKHSSEIINNNISEEVGTTINVINTPQNNVNNLALFPYAKSESPNYDLNNQYGMANGPVLYQLNVFNNNNSSNITNNTDNNIQ